MQREEMGLKLAHIFGDGMVLQRNKQVKLWGMAPVEKRVALHIEDRVYESLSQSDGKWEITMEPMAAGGPYTIEVKVEEQTIEIKDVLFGDIWLCSGQSNMELPVARVMEKYREEVNSYENPNIRMFRVEMAYDFNTPLENVIESKWISVNQEDVQNFNALGYFYAKALYEHYQVPIGLINTAIGGSRLECWLGENELKQYPDAVSQLEIYKDTKRVSQIMAENENSIQEWFSRLEKMDGGLNGLEKWYEPKLQTKEWHKFQIPGRWQKQGINISAGSVWFRKDIEIDKSLLSKKARILLGTIVDSDRVFINGIEVGRTEYQYPPRIYEIPKGVLKEGKNNITIRAIENSNQGEFTLEKFYGIELGEEKIDLSGEWLYRIGAEIEPLTPQIFLQFKPLGLYNAMIYPIRNMEICGVIWYQGESNTDKEASIYKERFETLIKSWRKLWRNDKLPFLYAQLTSYGHLENEPVESGWAEVRQGQLETLELPYTGMAVSIDIGEWNDLHPLNKKDLGQRLALAAEAIAYGEDKVYSGPIIKSAEVKEGKVILSFDSVGGGLTTKDEKKLREVAISDDHQHFIWAEAVIKDNQVIVWNDEINSPCEVRYAWSDSPIRANLCNKEGLMASPFKIMCSE